MDCSRGLTSRFSLVATCVVGAAIGFAQSAALALGTNANIDIVGPISIEELDNLNFGKIIPPSAGSQKFKIDEDTGAPSITGAGSGGAFVTGHHRGHYSITGVTGAFYVLQPTFGGCTDSHLALTTIAVNGSNSLPSDVLIGGSLQVTAGILNGPYTCSYTLAAHY